MDDKLTVFIALTAIAVLLQAGVLAAMYFTMRKTSARMEALAGEVKGKLLPAVEEAQQMLTVLRPKVDILVASCHWGLGREPLKYMTEIGRAAIDAGADVVVGHGPHYSLPVELYKGRPIYYGLGNLCFKTGHLGRRHENWIGMVAEVSFDDEPDAFRNINTPAELEQSAQQNVVSASR